MQGDFPLEERIFNRVRPNMWSTVSIQDWVTFPIAFVPSYACSELSESLKGRLAVIRRGKCTFVEKVRHAQNAGAVGVLVGTHCDCGVYFVCKFANFTTYIMRCNFFSTVKSN